jgi:hypothetical protein
VQIPICSCAGSYVCCMLLACVACRVSLCHPSRMVQQHAPCWPWSQLGRCTRTARGEQLITGNKAHQRMRYTKQACALTGGQVSVVRELNPDAATDTWPGVGATLSPDAGSRVCVKSWSCSGCFSIGNSSRLCVLMRSAGTHVCVAQPAGALKGAQVRAVDRIQPGSNRHLADIWSNSVTGQMFSVRVSSFGPAAGYGRFYVISGCSRLSVLIRPAGTHVCVWLNQQVL